VVNNGKEPTGANYYNMIGNSADGAAKPTPTSNSTFNPNPNITSYPPVYNPNATPNPERTGYGNIAGFGTEPLIEILPV
jgi:hypothetical protein